MKTTNEPRLIIVSSTASLAIGGAGVAAAVLTGAGSILADGVYSVLSAVISLASLPVLRLVKKGGDARYHFGYAAFEPLYVIMSTLAIIATQAPLAVGALRSLAAGGSRPEMHGALAYELFSTLSCLVLAAAIRSRAKRAGSPILRAESRSWFVDSVLSLGVLGAFAAALVLDGGPFDAWVPYIDPGITLTLVAAMLPALLGSALGSLRELLSAAPDRETQEEVRAVLAAFSGERGVAAIDAAMEKVGRTLNVEVQLILSRDLKASALAALEARIERSLKARWPEGSTDFKFSLAAPARLAPRSARQGKARGIEAVAAQPEVDLGARV
jgi:cation diffusion facilitator family transporter